MFLLCVFSGSDQAASFGGTMFRYDVPSAALFFVCSKIVVSVAWKPQTNHVFVLLFAFLDVYWCVVLDTKVY